MPGNVDLILFVTGFLVTAGAIGALGHSLLEDHDRKQVIPATVGAAIVCGALVGWALQSFFNFASQPGPMP